MLCHDELQISLIDGRLVLYQVGLELKPAYKNTQAVAITWNYMELHGITLDYTGLHSIKFAAVLASMFKLKKRLHPGTRRSHASNCASVES